MPPVPCTQDSRERSPCHCPEQEPGLEAQRANRAQLHRLLPGSLPGASAASRAKPGGRVIPGCRTILSVQWPAAVRRLPKCIALTVVGYTANGATGCVGATPLPGNQNEDEQPAGTRPPPAGASQASQHPSIPTWGDTANYVVSSYLRFLLLWGYSSSQPGTSAGRQAKNRASARPWL